jgi:CBS domain-containing protein
MRDQHVSSLIVDGRPPGLVTATDLRDRVLAAGLDPDTPVGQVMTTPLHTMPAEATLGELLLAMVDRGVHHLPLTRHGRLVGMVTDTDLLRHQSRHPLLVRRQLDRATGAEELAAYAREVTAAAARLVRAGAPAGDVTRFVASAQDALYLRAVHDGEAALGPPPCPYALLILGSGARREPTLRTDQDHALVLADNPPPDADAWFAALAERLAATLERCGLPRCPGDVMATNPARRVPLGAWQEQFARWIEQPEEEALLAAAIFFDFRQLHGDLDAERPLRRVVGWAAGTVGSWAAWPRRPCAAGPRWGSSVTCAPSSGAGSTSRRTAPPRSSTWPGWWPWRRAARRQAPWPGCGRRPSVAWPVRPPLTWLPRSSTCSSSACGTRPTAWPPATSRTTWWPWPS